MRLFLCLYFYQCYNLGRIISIGEKMNKLNFDNIDQIPVVHVSVKSAGDETLIKYESNDEKLLEEVVSRIDKKVFIVDDLLCH